MWRCIWILPIGQIPWWVSYSKSFRIFLCLQQLNRPKITQYHRNRRNERINCANQSTWKLYSAVLARLRRKQRFENFWHRMGNLLGLEWRFVSSKTPPSLILPLIRIKNYVLLMFSRWPEAVEKRLQSINVKRFHANANTRCMNIFV